jgi:hypothetical protein
MACSYRNAARNCRRNHDAASSSILEKGKYKTEHPNDGNTPDN